MCEALDSVIKQTYLEYEIIVINDGSPENLDGFLKKYEDKIRYFYQENGGPGSARNLGIKMATGDYIAFLDSDDIWKNNKLELQIKAMERSNYKWSHTSYETFCGDKIISKISVKNFNGAIYPKMLASSPLATPCIVIKKEIFEKKKDLRFNEKLRYGQDSNLWIQIAVEYPILAIDDVLTRVRIRGTNAGKRAVVQMKARCNGWHFLKSNDKLFFATNLPTTMRFAYKVSCMGASIINFCEKRNLSSGMLEMISKVLYFLPWLFFKSISKTTQINKYKK